MSDYAAPLAGGPAQTGQDRVRGPGQPQRRRKQLLDELAEVMPLLARGFKVHLRADLRHELHGLTLYQLEAVTALDQGSLTMSELCERLDIAESAGTALVDKLVAHGFAERSGDSSDRRVVRVALTSQAREMVKRFRDLRRDTVERALEVLDLASLEAFVGYCKQIAAQTPSQRHEEAN